jgi:hypothetical protein
MENDKLKLAVVMFVMMFKVSGTTKILNFNSPKSEGLRLSKVLNTTLSTSENLVLIAGIFELVMTGMVIYGIYHDKSYLKPGVYGLMAFTALVTLVFYTSPFKYKPFLSNLSVLTGLYLILRVCEFKS